MLSTTRLCQVCSRPPRLILPPALEFLDYRTCSTRKEPAGRARRRSASLPVCSSHADQSARSSTTICLSWIGATSGLGSVVSRVKASPPVAMGRHKPAKQNQSSPAFVNFHFVFGDFVPVNSKKCDAGTRQRPTESRRPSERKLMIGGPLGRAGRRPHRNSEKPFVPSWRRRMTGAQSVGQMSSRGSRFGAVLGHFTGIPV
jgi:hypothetical protein